MDLNIKGKNYGKGKIFNRLLNNTWNRNYFVNNLVKRCNLNKIGYDFIRPEYSSFIGHMKYPLEYDSIAAAIEIGYRGYLKGNNLNEYDSINSKVCINQLSTQWKKMVSDDKEYTYRELYNLFKEKKKINSYRFLFDCKGRSYLRLSSYKSGIDLYII